MGVCTKAAFLVAMLIFLSACGVGDAGNNISLQQRIDNYIEEHGQNIAGLAISVFTKEDMVLEIEYGYANIEAGLAIDAGAVFEWGALTKQLVWVSAMQLYERGELDLHANIFTYIPEANFPNIVYPTTMFHLMHHAAGFDDYVNSGFANMIVGEAVPALDALIISMTATEHAAQNWQPGQRVRYSIYGTLLASYVVQQVAGVPFYEYVHCNIFAPLGMHHTALLPDMADNPWVQQQRKNIMVYDMWGLQFFQRRQMLAYPTAAAVGTMSDMVRFARGFLPDKNGNSALFAHAETLSMLHPSREDILNTSQCELLHMNVAFFYGIGILADSSDGSEPARVVGHIGATAGFRVFWFIDIDAGIGMVMGENTTHGIASASRFLRFFTNEIPALASQI